MVQSNFHSKWGEIDLIMRKGQELLFVEVRSKSNFRYGQPAETVNDMKQEKIRKTAQLLSLSASRIRAMQLPL